MRPPASRLRHDLVPFGWASAIMIVAAGCYSSGGDDDDSPPDVCVGHWCPENNPLMAADDGGEAVITIANSEQGQRVVKMGARFISSQLPEKITVPKFDGCINMFTQETWGQFQWYPGPRSQGVLERKYLSGGAQVTMGGQNGDFALSIATSCFTPVGPCQREFLENSIEYEDHPMDGRFPGPGFEDTGFAGNYYSVNYTPSNNLPDLELDEALYVPKDFSNSQGIFGNPVLSVASDYEVTWDPAPETEETVALVVFKYIGGAGPTTVICAGDNDGSIVVPADFVRQVPSTGLILLIVAAHRVREINARRFDVLGENCVWGPYTTDG